LRQLYNETKQGGEIEPKSTHAEKKKEVEITKSIRSGTNGDEDVNANYSDDGMDPISARYND